MATKEGGTCMDRPTVNGSKKITEADLWDQQTFSGAVFRLEGGDRIRVAMIQKSTPTTLDALLGEEPGAYGKLVIRPHGSPEVEIDVGRKENHAKPYTFEQDEKAKRERWMAQGKDMVRAETREELKKDFQWKLERKDIDIERLENRLAMAEDRAREHQNRAERLDQEVAAQMQRHRQEMRDLDRQFEQERKALREKLEEQQEAARDLKDVLLEIKHEKGEKGFFDSLAQHIGPELPNILRMMTAAQVQRSQGAQNQNSGSSRAERARPRSLPESRTRTRQNRAQSRSLAATSHEHASPPSRAQATPPARPDSRASERARPEAPDTQQRPDRKSVV